MKSAYTNPVMHFVPMVKRGGCTDLAQLPTEALADVLRQCKEAEELKVYQANLDIIPRRIVDEWVLVPTGSFAQNFNGMISLNECRHFIWEQFRTAKALGEVLRAAKEEFSDEHYMLDFEVRELVSDCVRIGLLHEV